jgi:hypothetical protein
MPLDNIYNGLAGVGDSLAGSTHKATARALEDLFEDDFSGVLNNTAGSIDKAVALAQILSRQDT